MSILITGGAGYIGSHTVKYFQEQNEEIIVVDNLQSGHEKSIDVDYLYKIDIRDKEQLDKVFKNHNIEAVIHFAANSIVEESMEKPYEYYHNNVFGTLCLLDLMKENKVDKIVFSSTAAIYGEPKSIPIMESDDLNPTNTYGETKLVMENMMKWFDQAYGTKYVSLRYFNAAGAYETGEIGEDHHPETHLIPLILQVPLGEREKIYIFGDDYPTEDGTCVRDYVHVMDLASAHYKALEYLRKGKDSDIFNLGNGKGYSVKEVIEVARKVTGYPISVEIKERRAGDPAILIASSEKAKSILGWEPEFDALEKIIADAWRWDRGANSLLTEKILNGELSSEGLIEHAYNCCMNIKTCYMWGGIMDILSEDIIKVLSQRYEDYYTEDKIARYESLIGKEIYGCDCSGLIKSYLFGGVNHPLYEELYDLNSSMMLYVSDRKGKIDTLPEIRGICLYMPGHVGIYVGNGQVIECTENERIGNGVVESNLMDRNWTDWFYCPFVTY